MLKTPRREDALVLKDIAVFHPAVTTWASQINNQPRWFAAAVAYVVLQATLPQR